MIREYTDKEIRFLKNRKLEHILNLDMENEENLEYIIDIMEDIISLEGLDIYGEYNRIGAICKDILLNIEDVDLYKVYGDSNFMYQNIIN